MTSLRAAWRMRKLGPSGQHLVIHVTPELVLLAKQGVASVSGNWSPTLLNLVLTHTVRVGASKVGMNERKLLEQERAAPIRRDGVRALLRSDNPEHAFEEEVDHSVKLAPLEGSLDSEVVQQQQQEQQKEQQRVEQRITMELTLADPKPWDLRAVLKLTRPDERVLFSVKKICLKHGSSTNNGLSNLQLDHFVATGNYLRVASKHVNATRLRPGQQSAPLAENSLCRCPVHAVGASLAFIVG